MSVPVTRLLIGATVAAVVMFAGLAVTANPEVGFVLQGAGAGALIGTAVVQWRRDRGKEVDSGFDHRPLDALRGRARDRLRPGRATCARSSLMSMPVARLLLGFLAATALIVLTLALAAPDTLGPWGQLALNVAAMLVLALFAPAYFGIDRESHRRR